MTNPRTNYQNWLSERRILLANAGSRLSRAVSSECIRFRRSSWPRAKQALLGLLRNSAAFLTDPLYPNYRSAVPAGATATNGRARMNDMRPVRESLADGHPLGHDNRTTTRQDRAVPVVESEIGCDETAATRFSMGAEDLGNDAHESFQAALASAIENMVHVENCQSTDQKLDAQLCELLNHRCKEFCSYIESKLNFSYDQTVLRLNALSDQIVKRFCESLSQQAAATLNAVVVASARQSTSALTAESQNALDRFGRQISDLTEAHLEAHRKEVQNLSSNLQVRLRRVAYTLEDVGVAALPRT